MGKKYNNRKVEAMLEWLFSEDEESVGTTIVSPLVPYSSAVKQISKMETKQEEESAHDDLPSFLISSSTTANISK